MENAPGFKVLKALNDRRYYVVFAENASALDKCSFPRGDEIAGIIEAESGMMELRSLLTEYMRVYPAFRSKPIGAPGSSARHDQDDKISLENEARKALEGE